MTHQCSKDTPESIRRTLEIMGDKWTALILRMLHEEPKRFKDFESQLDGISPRTLSQRLDMLTDENIIEKDDGLRSPYKLTKKGEDLDSVIHQMAEWGERYG